MAAGKHRALNPHRNRVGNVVAAGAVPLVLAIVGSGQANAAPVEPAPVAHHDDAPQQWPPAEAPNVAPYEGLNIPDETHSSIQWSRPAPDKSYLAPVGVLHPPVPVAPVPPIAPPPGKFRFGDVVVDAPNWIDKEQAIQINDNAAQVEANLATFLDSIGMERSRSDRIAGQTIGTAAVGALAGAATAAPFALTSAAVGGAVGLVTGLAFVPVGLVAGPVLGAAAGAAVITVPAAAVGAAAGAVVGAVNSFNAPPRVVGD
ncbi:Uncharacterised protein [Nocardia otitidiscaviarum]|uniref:Uncharacterized protein n=1 Tax=Nocardia otitidiscaviarum TaxID=1823 RepID=A0A379JLH5_9NOCA|nr:MULTISPECIES: hypothetical protein [Nocardia]MCP9619287.1 hypothetical protein [Nocardia otitidiscaviarum]SUD49224.1 Uncharacterised protein [Nocardia otitidiscaviarum]